MISFHNLWVLFDTKEFKRDFYLLINQIFDFAVSYL